jgi:DHA1 family chloramphenicol resistance protein-like MFS transporter
VFSVAGSAPTLAAAFNISAFNVGITVGPWLGGLALDAGAGYASVGWIGAGLGVLAVGTIPLAIRAAGRADRAREDQPAYESASSITGA